MLHYDVEVASTAQWVEQPLSHIGIQSPATAVVQYKGTKKINKKEEIVFNHRIKCFGQNLIGNSEAVTPLLACFLQLAVAQARDCSVQINRASSSARV